MKEKRTRCQGRHGLVAFQLQQASEVLEPAAVCAGDSGARADVSAVRIRKVWEPRGRPAMDLADSDGQAWQRDHGSPDRWALKSI